MIGWMFALAVIVTVNGAVLLAARMAARKYDVALPLNRSVGAAILCVVCVAQVFIVARQADDLQHWALVVALSAAVACAVTDAITGFVFDAVTLPALAIIILLRAFGHSFMPALLGAAAGGVTLGFLYAITRGRGLGFGDVKLACCIGAALGPADTVMSLWFAFVAGGGYAVFMLLTRRARLGDAVYFAPYLTGGMIAVELYRLGR